MTKTINKNQQIFFIMSAGIALTLLAPAPVFFPAFLVACFIGFVVSVFGAIKGFQ